MKHTAWLATSLILCAVPASLTAQTLFPRLPRPPRYIVLDTRRMTTIKRELTWKAMQGYRVVLAAPRPGAGIIPAGMTLILEKLSEGAPTPEYWMVESKAGFPMDELGVGARRGYHYIKRSAFEHRGHDFMGDLFASAIWGEKHVNHQKYDTITGYALMEKIPGRETSCLYAIEMQDPRHGHRAVMDQLRSGFQVVGELEQRLILEKCYERAASADGTERHALPPQSGSEERLRLLSTDNWAKRQRLLQGAVAEGFLVSHSFGKWVGLEKRELFATPPHYTVLGAKSELELEKKLNETTGSQVIPDSLVRKSSFWSGSEYQIVMEKAGGDGQQYGYKVLRDKQDTDLQDAINAAAAKGYEVEGLSRDVFGITVILGRLVVSEATPTPQLPEPSAAAIKPL